MKRGASGKRNRWLRPLILAAVALAAAAALSWALPSASETLIVTGETISEQSEQKLSVEDLSTGDIRCEFSDPSAAEIAACTVDYEKDRVELSVRARGRGESELDVYCAAEDGTEYKVKSYRVTVDLLHRMLIGTEDH